MPYSMNNMPESMKGAPQHAMDIFIAAFNTAFEKSHKDEKGQWMSSGRDTEHRVPTSNHTEWTPVFRTDTHTDSEGNEKAWTEAELDQIAAQYRPEQHEAPVVIGHPKDNSPAWGWVEALKRDGHILYAKFKDLVPEFVDMVRKGLFKKRSISLYPDMTLRHVGFLGAMPPAVKGLPDVAFRDGDGQIIEFAFDCKQCNRCRDTEHRVPTINNFCRREAKRMKWFEWMKKKAEDEGLTLEDAPTNFSAPNPPPAPPPAGDIKTHLYPTWFR